MPILAYFHIVTHALFKALLFVCVGTFINYHRHTQDLRWIGNLTHQLPTIISCIILANLALSGFPFLAGFYSKDIIIEFMLISSFNRVMLVITIISLGLTAFYSIRATLVAIIGNQIGLPFSHQDEPLHIKTAVITLSMSAIVIGSSLIWLTPNLIIFSSSLSTSIKVLPLLLMLGGRIIAWLQTSLTSTNTSKLINSAITNYASCIIWFLVPLSTQFTISSPFFCHSQFNKNRRSRMIWTVIWSRYT